MLNVCSFIIRWLLVALTLAAGLVVVLIACTVRVWHIITSHNKVQAAEIPVTYGHVKLAASKHQQPAPNFNRVVFHRCTGQMIDVTKLYKENKTNDTRK